MGQNFFADPKYSAPRRPAAPFANPTLPLQLPTAQEDLRGKQLSNEKTAATLAAEESKAKAEATTAELAAKQAQEQWNINHPQANGTATMSGPQYMHYLQQTNPGRAAYIQGLSEGRIPFPSAQMMRTPAGQALLTDVMRADPTIDATNYTTRAAERKNAATGRLGASDNALITSIGHAARLETLIPDVAGGPVRPLNWAENLIEGNLFNGKQPTYDQNAQLLGDEVAAAYNTNSQGKQNEAGLQFSSSLSTRQKQDNILGAMDLMASKLAANRAQFAYGNGQLGKPDFMLLPPQTQQEIQKIPGADKIFAKYFAGVPVMGQNGNDQPPSNGGGNTTPPGPGFSPAPTGATNGGLTPSTNGYNETPDPQSAQFWADAARNGTPYRAALQNWQSDVKARGLTGITPPPPDAYHKAARYIEQNPNIPYQPFSSITKTPVNPDVQAALTKAAFNGPTVGLEQTANAAAGTLPTRLAGDQGDRFNAVSNALHPNWSLAGNIAGTALGAYGVGKAIEGIAPFLGAYGNIIGGNSSRAALTGDTLFVGGSGAAQNPDNPVAGAVGGMAAGAGGNLLGRYVVGPSIRAALDTKAGQNLINLGGRGISNVRGMFGGGPIPAFNPPAALDSGQNLLFNRGVNNGAIDGIRSNLEDASNLNLPYMLADSNPKLRALAGTVARKSADVAANVTPTLNARALGQADRAVQGIDTHLAPIPNVEQQGSDLLNAADQAAAPYYERAFSRPGPVDPQIASMLNTPAGKASLANARTIALNNRMDPNALGIDLDEEGNPKLVSVPSYKTLQLVKRGMDAHLNSFADQFGNLNLRGNPLAQSVLDLRNGFNARLGEINPDYAKGNEIWSQIASQKNALDQGYNTLPNNAVPQRQFDASVSNLNDQTLPYAQGGYAANMADTVNKARYSGNPYNAIYGSPLQQSKVAALFPDGAPNFNRLYNLENDMAATRGEVLGGSQTATRTEADKAFDNAEIATDLAMAIPTKGASLAGMLMTGARKAGGYLSDKTSIGMNTAKANALAPYLFNDDPKTNLLMLNNMMAQQAARRAYLQNFGAVTGNLGAGMFGAPMVYGASGQ